MICHKSDSDSISKCIDALIKQKVLIVPTDTVYGFSGIVDSTNLTENRIKQIKGRDEKKPFIQLIAKPEDIHLYTDETVPSEILKYWPGPLTIILLDNRLKDREIKTTAFRCPGDKWLRDVIEGCNTPIYSTSVNRSGSPVLETEEEILKEFEKETDLIVLDGDRKNSLPSTIIKIENEKIIVLREGAVKL